MTLLSLFVCWIYTHQLILFLRVLENTKKINILQHLLKMSMLMFFHKPNEQT